MCQFSHIVHAGTRCNAENLSALTGVSYRRRRKTRALRSGARLSRLTCPLLWRLARSRGTPDSAEYRVPVSPCKITHDTITSVVSIDFVVHFKPEPCTATAATKSPEREMTAADVHGEQSHCTAPGAECDRLPGRQQLTRVVWKGLQQRDGGCSKGRKSVVWLVRDM